MWLKPRRKNDPAVLVRAGIRNLPEHCNCGHQRRFGYAPGVKHRVRIGYVKYLNTLPLVEGLDAWLEVELVPAVPSRLGDMLHAGEIDVSLSSVIDFARSPVPLAFLPVGMIGCDGPTLTVRLFSAVPFARVTAVHADTDSHTSVALAQVVLESLHNVRPKLIDFDARERVETSNAKMTEWPETMLLIGDKVVTDCPPAVRYPYQLDLGDAWHATTALPFVYAMWMCHKASVEPFSPKRVAIEAAMRVLDRQRRRNIMRTSWIIEQYASQRRWPADLARRYVTEFLRYSVGQRERLAVARFLDAASGLGLCPDIEPVFHELPTGDLSHAATSPTAAGRAEQPGRLPSEMP